MIYNGLYGRYMQYKLCILTVQRDKHTRSLVAFDRWSLYTSIINAKTFGTSTTWPFKTSGRCIEVVANTGFTVLSKLIVVECGVYCVCVCVCVFVCVCVHVQK